MINKTIRLLSFVLLFITITSCSEYQKALKSEETKVKYDLAEKLYNEGNYKKALRLLEQIVPNYVGKPQGERVIFFYANSYFQTKDYYLAAYQFERFIKAYPRSEKTEEAAFLGAKSQYMISPKYSIDQKETLKGLDVLQVFINAYPNSGYLPEANAMAQELKAKVERKAFEIAKQYNTIMDYKASLKSFDLFLSEYPGSVYREDALYYKLVAQHNLAANSIQSLMEGRLNESKAAYDALIKYFPETKYKEDADRIMDKINRELQQFSK